jgi:hypothetical protein
MPRFVAAWAYFADTGQVDKYGSIHVELGTLNGSGVRVYRRRQLNNKGRYLYWTDKDQRPRGSLEDVIMLQAEQP